MARPNNLRKQDVTGVCGLGISSAGSVDPARLLRVSGWRERRSPVLRGRASPLGARPAMRDGTMLLARRFRSETRKNRYNRRRPIPSPREATMTIAAQPTAPPAPAAEEGDVPTEPIYRLSVAQYHAMARHGILDEDAPVELLEGWLVQKMTKHRPHSRCTHRTRRALERILPAGWYVDTQEPVTTAESEPEPD